MSFDPLQRHDANGLAIQPYLTQGAVLDGIALPRYGQGRYAAVVITARCDVAHVRTDTLNVLPVLPISHWLRYDGRVVSAFGKLLAFEKTVSDLVRKLPTGLQDLMTGDWPESYASFVAPNQDVAPELKNKLKSAVEGHARLRNLLENGCASPSSLVTALSSDAELSAIIESTMKKKVPDLLENKVIEAHFLPVIRPEEPVDEGPGYVVAFRQILAFPGRLLDLMTKGFDSLDDVPPELKPVADQLLVFPAGIISNLASPHVEHLMQRFSTLFGRIGVDDCSDQYKSWVVEACSRELGS